MSASVEVFRATGTDDTGRAFGSINRNIQNTKRNADKLNGSLRMMRGGMGQLGHQIQDVAVQLQMGQNPLMVLTQQGSQVASLFGPTGAVIGAIGAVAGAMAAAFIPQLMSGKDRTEELHDQVKNLADLMSKDAKTGAITYAGALAEVASNSKSAARNLQLDALELAADRMKELRGEIKTTIESFDDVTIAATGGIGGIIEAHDRLGLSKQAYDELNEALNNLDINSQQGRESVLDMMVGLKMTQLAAGGVDEEFGELVNDFQGAHSEMSKLNKQMDEFSSAAPEVANVTGDLKTKFDSWFSSIQSKVQKAEGMTPAQMLGIELQNMEGLSQAQIDLGAALIRRLRAAELAAQKSKDLADADRDAAAATRELEKAQKAQANADAKAIAGAGFAEGIIAAATAKREENQKRLEEIRVGFLGEMELLREQENEKREFINGLAESYFTEEMTREQMLTDLAKDYANRRKAIYQNEAEERARVQAAGNAVIQQGLEFMAQNLKEGSALQKTAFLATRAFAASEAIVSAELAAAKVLAHDAGILGLGAIASSNLIRGVGYASAAMIMAQAVASFEGGGFTGRGARSGGLDGKGGFMAMLHPNETVYDHTKGQGQGVTIVTNVDARGSGPDVEIKIRKAVEQGNKQTIAIIRDLAGRGRLV